MTTTQGQAPTDDNTVSAAAITQVLAYLDGLSDDAAAHIYPSDLEKCMTSECVVEVASVRAGNGYERTVPLFSREQVVDALASAPAQPVAEAHADVMEEWQRAEIERLRSALNDVANVPPDTVLTAFLMRKIAKNAIAT